MRIVQELSLSQKGHILFLLIFILLSRTSQMAPLTARELGILTSCIPRKEGEITLVSTMTITYGRLSYKTHS